jgi:hypothetical protein
MHVPFDRLVATATRFAVLTSTHGATHAVADALAPLIEWFLRTLPLKVPRHRRHPVKGPAMQPVASLLVALVFTLAAAACHRKAAVEATKDLGPGHDDRSEDARQPRST